MALESATYISQLVATNPVVGDPVGQGDDHVRLLKTVLQAQFPNFTAAALAATNAQIDAAVNTAKGTSGVFLVPLASAANPSYSFVGDSNTGIYSPGADQVSVSCGGSAILAVGTTGASMVGGLTLSQGLSVGAGLSVTGTVALSTPLTGANIANTTIAAANIVANTITASQIANATITTTQISGSAGITGAQLSASAAIAITQIATDTGNKGKVLGYDVSTGVPTPFPAAGLVVHVREEQNSGTNGTSATLTAGSWSTRVLNTSKTNEVTGASLASNQVTLPAGTYEVSGFCEAFGSPGYLGAQGFKARLRDTTNSATLVVGTNDYNNSAVGGGTGTGYQAMTVRSEVRGRFTLSGSAALELQHYPVSTNLSNAGQALTTGEKEVYAELFIRLIKI